LFLLTMLWFSFTTRIRQLAEDVNGTYNIIQGLRQDIRMLTGRIKLVEDENKKANDV
jgi:hypothetical protein